MEAGNEGRVSNTRAVMDTPEGGPTLRDRESLRMKAEVDPAKCCGYALCTEVCPEVFKLDDAGFAFAGVVPPGLESKVREAVDACPESAIRVEE